ncbi:MAG TPA: SH3 domain-containing protein [Actinophytocola sp.]|uniref:SH3 domain-containing protein n=1 Tax=Actinophytocola sp. TaxID=1872138 RepID=UPI002DDD8852|nr:SH3 domain-containing protein [Actinophytocola sp.]HEV2782037.1 SH3 domain-containing protein [Actinophytocola sp.]
MIGAAVVGVLVLYVLGSETRPDQDAGSTANPSQCRIASTVDGLRVRSAPTLDSAIVDRLNSGDETDADKVVENGFRKIGEGRWVSAEFTRPLPGRDCG